MLQMWGDIAEGSLGVYGELVGKGGAGPAPLEQCSLSTLQMVLPTGRRVVVVGFFLIEL